MEKMEKTMEKTRSWFRKSENNEETISSNEAIKNEKNELVHKVSVSVKEFLVATQNTKIVTEFTPELTHLMDSVSAIFHHGLKTKFKIFDNKGEIDSFWPFVSSLTSKGNVEMIEKKLSLDSLREKAWLSLAISENSIGNYLENIKIEKSKTKSFYEDNAVLLDDERVEILQNLFISLQGISFQLGLEVKFPWESENPKKESIPEISMISKLRMAISKDSKDQKDQKDEHAELKSESYNEKDQSSFLSQSVPDTPDYLAQSPNETQENIVPKKKPKAKKKGIKSAKKIVDLSDQDYSLPKSLEGPIEPSLLPQLGKLEIDSGTPTSQSTDDLTQEITQESIPEITQKITKEIIEEFNQETKQEPIKESIQESTPQSPDQLPKDSSFASVTPRPYKELHDDYRRESYGSLFRRHVQNQNESDVFTNKRTFDEPPPPKGIQYPSKLASQTDVNLSSSPDTKNSLTSDDEENQDERSKTDSFVETNPTIEITSSETQKKEKKKEKLKDEAEIDIESEKDRETDTEKEYDHLDVDKIGEDETKPRGNSFYDSATQLVSNISSMLSSNLVGKPVDKNDDDYFMIDSNEKISQPTPELSIIYDICPEKGLNEQQFKCFECHRQIGVGIFGEARVCDYTGHYYCNECHINDTAYIPARIVRNWDFKKQRVCKKSKAFLRSIEKRPMIPLFKLNPILETLVEEINDIVKIRKELSSLKGYLDKCPRLQSDKETKNKLFKKIWPRDHLMDEREVDLFSLQDLVETPHGQLHSFLKGVKDAYRDHVTKSCEVCKFLGSYCAFCQKKSIIYPFDQTTIRCPNCTSLAHRACFVAERCPTCQKKKALKS